LLPELARVGNPGLFALPVRSVSRLVHRNRDEPLALLPRRLCDQLLDPEAEASRDRADLHLVAPILPGLTHPLAELEPRVALVEAAGLHHLLDTEQKALEVDADERRRDHAEDRERRVASADRRLAGEDGAEPPLAGGRPERRAR